MAIAYRGAGSIPQRRPVTFSVGGGDDVACDLHGMLHGTDPVPGRSLGRGADNFYDRLSASRPANWFLGFLRLFGPGQAFGFALRNRDLSRNKQFDHIQNRRLRVRSTSFRPVSALTAPAAAMGSRALCDRLLCAHLLRWRKRMLQLNCFGVRVVESFLSLLGGAHAPAARRLRVDWLFWRVLWLVGLSRGCWEADSPAVRNAPGDLIR
jgi:hypothetical protein